MLTLSSASYELRMTTEHIEREVDAPVVVVIIVFLGVTVLKQGMDHLHLPTVDFFFAPKVEPMFRGVDYISKHVAAGGPLASHARSRAVTSPSLSPHAMPLTATQSFDPEPHMPPAAKKVYVHCKAGRGRSACLVCCYLIASGA